MVQVNKKVILVALAVLVVIGTAIFVFANPNLNKGRSEALAKKAVDYLNSSILQGRTATLTGASTQSGVVKFTMDIEGRTYTSYVSTDGKILFPEGIDLGAQLPGSQTPPPAPQPAPQPSPTPAPTPTPSPTPTPQQ